METQTAPTKTPPTDRTATDPAPDSEALRQRAARLAAQLDLSADELTARALSIGLLSIDWNLAFECTPFTHPEITDFPGFDLSAEMDALGESDLADLEAGGEYAQAVILQNRTEAAGFKS